MVSPVARANGIANRASLDLVRTPLQACQASEVLAAIATDDAAHALERRLLAEGHEAHRAPTTARRRHHDLVVADLTAGRYPSDVGLWTDVIDADHDLERAKARVAAAAVAVERASRAVQAAFSRAWPVVLPDLATHRSEPASEVLDASTAWPALSAPPGVETTTTWTAMHYALWWPLSLQPLVHTRRDHAEWNEWAWSELAAGRYDAHTDAAVITLRERWTPPKFSSITSEGVQQLRQPVVFVTPERIAEHERSIAQQR